VVTAYDNSMNDNDDIVERFPKASKQQGVTSEKTSSFLIFRLEILKSLPVSVRTKTISFCPSLAKKVLVVIDFCSVW
jgi:hypothetical protein